ncbi:MAG: fasciclin domain-containing protein [Silvanigrellales bacterium]|nr:fasciclin domain-containing protein [Silvanigrellales bacterium]
MKKILVPTASLLAVFSASLLVASCGDDSKDEAAATPTPAPSGAEATILELAAKTPSLSTLANLVVLCKLDGALKESGDKTVFAPSNDAFAKAFPTAPTKCTDDVKTTLLSHVIGKKIAAKDIAEKEAEVASLAGPVFAKKSGSSVLINGNAKVTTADVMASNGVVHIIDKVLTPDSLGTVVDIAAKRAAFTSLVSLVTACDLADTLADKAKTYTVFAPTNDAFKVVFPTLPKTCAASTKTTLLNHVIGSKILAKDIVAAETEVASLGGPVFAKKASSKVLIDGAAEVVAADVTSANGVVHVINKVLKPDSLGTVVDALAKRSDFSSLVSTAVTADVAGALTTAPSITVFAPTNAAFAAISSVTAGLSATQLADVLKNHVIAEKILAADVIANAPINAKATLRTGTTLDIAVSSAPVTVSVKVTGSSNTASTVTATDIVTSNGVIHTVSSVILP